MTKNQNVAIYLNDNRGTMTKNKKIFLSVFALAIIGLGSAIAIGLSTLKERYSVLDKIAPLGFSTLVTQNIFEKDQYPWDEIGSLSGQNRYYRVYAIDPEGNEWLGVKNEGIIVRDTSGKGFASYNESNSGLESNTILDIAFDDQGVAWISTFRWKTGLNSFDGNAWKTHDVAGGKIAFDHQGRVWVASDYRVSVFDGVNWTHYAPGASRVVDIVVDGLDRVWIMSDDYGGGICELCMFDGSVWKYFYRQHPYDRTFAPTSRVPYIGFDEANTLAVDTNGNVWFFSDQGGYEISNNLPLFTLSEVNFLFASDTGVFLSLFLILASLWLVFAMPSWRNMAIGIVAGETIYFVSIALFNLDVLYFSPIAAIPVITCGVLGGVLGWLIGIRTGAARRRLIIGLVVAVAIVSSIVYCISILPQ